MATISMIDFTTLIFIVQANTLLMTISNHDPRLAPLLLSSYLKRCKMIKYPFHIMPNLKTFNK